MNFPIDWSATGTWMQAWAGFAQAAAVVFAADKAANVYGAWRRQKIEERRLDCAEQVLTVAYQLRSALILVRDPWPNQEETILAEKRLKDLGYQFAEYERDGNERLLKGHVIFERLKKFSVLFEQVDALLPRSTSLFGEEVSKPLFEMSGLWNRVTADVKSFIDGTEDLNFLRELKVRLGMMTPTNEFRDQTGELISSNIALLERVLLPVIRHENNYG